jgi:Tfp pilus assembly protein PilO
MKGLFSAGSSVPFSRVMRDYRAWVIPVGLVLAASIAVLILVVLPMSASADAAEQRARTANEARVAAARELADAQATRDAQAQSAKDLDEFYADVLPADVRTAARLMTLKLSQLARDHNVTFERNQLSPEALRNSSLERLRVSYALTGQYNDIRRLIYDIETSADFIVIDNVFLAEGQNADAPLALTLDLSTFYRTANAQ